MARPSANLDKKMLEAGVQVIIKEGVEGLTARNICKYADVNLGMFNYYFKSKDYYISLLYSGLHKHIDEFLDIESVQSSSSLVKLKHALIRIYQFSQKHPSLAAALFSDFFYRYDTFKDYVERGIIPQFDLMIKLIATAKEDGFLRQDVAVMDVFSLLFFGCIAPEIYSAQLRDLQKFRKLKKDDAVSKNSFSKRMELLFTELENIDANKHAV